MENTVSVGRQKDQKQVATYHSFGTRRMALAGSRFALCSSEGVCNLKIENRDEKHLDRIWRGRGARRTGDGGVSSKRQRLDAFKEMDTDPSRTRKKGRDSPELREGTAMRNTATVRRKQNQI